MTRSGDESGKPKSRRLKRFVIGVACILLICLGITVVVLPRMNRFQTEGDLGLRGISQAVTILRDEKGMPYIYAENYRDLIFGQGFAAAQDRLFQMQLMLLQAQGRLSELAGEMARDADVRSRTIGIHRIAKAHATILDEPSRVAFQAYVDGINAFLDNCKGDTPMEFRLAGLQAQPWTVEDSLSILYLMSWDTSANVKHEIVTQMLVDRLGQDLAKELPS